MIKVIYSDTRFSIDKPEGLISGGVNSLSIQNNRSLKKAIEKAKSYGLDINSTIYIRDIRLLFYKKRKVFLEDTPMKILSFDYNLTDDILMLNVNDRYGYMTQISPEHIITEDVKRNNSIEEILNN